MDRWDPRSMPGARADDDPVRITEDVDDVDDPAETVAHARQHISRIDNHLALGPPTDPDLFERLRRDRAHWARVIDAVGLPRPLGLRPRRSDPVLAPPGIGPAHAQFP